MERNFFRGSALATWLGFTATFAARPLGGMFLGLLSDTFGRKLAVVITGSGMLLATVGQGLLPTPRAWGEDSMTGQRVCSGSYAIHHDFTHIHTIIHIYIYIERDSYIIMNIVLQGDWFNAKWKSLQIAWCIFLLGFTRVQCRCIHFLIQINQLGLFDVFSQDNLAYICYLLCDYYKAFVQVVKWARFQLTLWRWPRKDQWEDVLP